ncbi:glutathione S-transferase [Physcia stellaris]|nr:glutathione S-transferase [Physcia stellaris]
MANDSRRIRAHILLGRYSTSNPMAGELLRQHDLKNGRGALSPSKNTIYFYRDLSGSTRRCPTTERRTIKETLGTIEDGAQRWPPTPSPSPLPSRLSYLSHSTSHTTYPPLAKVVVVVAGDPATLKTDDSIFIAPEVPPFFASPGGRHRAAGILSLFIGGTWAFVGQKVNGGDSNAIKGLNDALARMSEDDVVGFGEDDGPRLGVWTTSADEAGDCAALECSDTGSSRMLVDSQAGSLVSITNAAPICARKILDFA